MITKTHNYQETLRNPWPLLASLCAFNFLISILLLIKNRNYNILVIRITIIITSALTWWNQIFLEMRIEGRERKKIERSLKNSIILFILSEVFFFASFFWSYTHFSVSPTLEIRIAWPPKMIAPFEFSNVPLVNTLILLRSGLTITISHKKLLEQKIKDCIKILIFTITLGLMFTALQVIEYKTSFFCISDSTFGRIFFILTGFHGIHVLIGFIYLAVVAKYVLSIKARNKKTLRFELSSWYWHFVDVVWIIVYFILYFLNS